MKREVMKPEEKVYAEAHEKLNTFVSTGQTEGPSLEGHAAG